MNMMKRSHCLSNTSSNKRIVNRENWSSLDIPPVINRIISKMTTLLRWIGGLIASVYASSGANHQHVDAIILNSPFLATLDTPWSQTVLGNVLMKFGLSSDVPDKYDWTDHDVPTLHFSWYTQSLHLAHKGEWDFDIQKKTIEKLRVHGPSFKAIYSAQEDLMKKGPCIKCPILMLCSNRSIMPGKVWRDEYGEGNWICNC